MQQEMDSELIAALEDAIECVQSWGDYASDYFQRKHDLAGDIARLTAVLEDAKAQRRADHHRRHASHHGAHMTGCPECEAIRAAAYTETV